MKLDIKSILIVLLALALLSSGGGMWKLKRQSNKLEREILIQEFEIIEYEKDINTLKDIAKNSSVSYDSSTLNSFDSTRASFKRHLEQLRLNQN